MSQDDDYVDHLFDILMKPDEEKIDPFPPDYDYYASFDAWELREAAALLCGYSPHQKLSFIFHNNKAIEAISKTLRLLEVAAEVGTIKLLPHEDRAPARHRMKPVDVLEWAKQKGIEVPRELVAAIAPSRVELQPNTKRPQQAEYNAQQREVIYRLALSALIKHPAAFRKKKGAFNSNALAAYLELVAAHAWDRLGGSLPLSLRTVQDLLRQVAKESEQVSWPDPGPAKTRSKHPH